jgi:hypothetical protein
LIARRTISPPWQSRQAVILRLAALFKRTKKMRARAVFQLVWVNCEALGIVLDYPEDAPIIDPN